MSLSASFGLSPFEIFEKDTDEVITIINFYILLGQQEETQITTEPIRKPVARKKDERIKVNDATATGGWF